MSQYVPAEPATDVRGGKSFTHRLRVRWAEVDLQQVVFFGNYAEYCDIAFTEFMREVGLPDPIAQQRAGRELFMRKMQIEYHASARFDDWLDIVVRCARIGRSSLTIRFGIDRAGERLADAEFVYVYAEPASGRSVEIPAEWHHRLLGASAEQAASGSGS
ncbi:MAG: acyl-CoA thioesterase [Casimicrobiaceae bacterium]